MQDDFRFMRRALFLQDGDSTRKAEPWYGLFGKESGKLIGEG